MSPPPLVQVDRPPVQRATALETQSISRDVLREHYARPGETCIDDVRRRIAAALALAEAGPGPWAQRFLDLQQAGFIAAGRIAAHAGSDAAAMMINCFVQPLAEGTGPPASQVPSIYATLAETAQTLRQGGGVGIDLTPMRPQGAADGGGTAAGPVAWLHLFDASATALESASARRGAQIGVLRCDHPDVVAFARAKAGAALSHFNLSVAVTDAFMHALEADATVELVHAAAPGPAQRAAGAHRREDGQWVYAVVPARALWQEILHAAHGQGEPGLLFIDRINAENNLAYCETLTATNPCGEEPLPPYGACCLGSFDLTRLVEHAFEGRARIDLDRLAALVPAAVRLLDNVLELSAWPLPQQRAEALSKRRIGLGFTGLGDALAMLGQHYDSDAARATAAGVARCLRDTAYAASVALARERGPFARFEAEPFLRADGFAARLPQSLQQAVRRHGLRNSHLLAIAPTGSVSLAFADNVSSGIEPVYAWRHPRQRRRRDGRVAAYEVENHAWRLWRQLRGVEAALPPAFVTTAAMPVQAQLSMVAAVAPYIDGAISKTVNAPEACSRADFDDLFRRAWQLGLKGVTAFRPNPVLGAVLQGAGGVQA